MARKKQGLFDKASERFDFPFETLAGKTRVTLMGNRAVRLEYHKGLVELEDYVISVNCGDYVIAVYGDKLGVVAMSAVEILIRGDIQRIELT